MQPDVQPAEIDRRPIAARRLAVMHGFARFLAARRVHPNLISIAGMVGALRFNRREGNDIPAVYGGVTTGSLWKFLRLVGDVVTLDLREYALAEVDKILGILRVMVGPVDGAAAA